MPLDLSNPQKVLTVLFATWPQAATALEVSHKVNLPVSEVERWLDQLWCDDVIESRLSEVMIGGGRWERRRYYQPACLAVEFTRMIGIL